MTFTCDLCGHEHDTRDQLLALPGICGWCGAMGGGTDDMYNGPDPEAL